VTRLHVHIPWMYPSLNATNRIPDQTKYHMISRDITKISREDYACLFHRHKSERARKLSTFRVKVSSFPC